MIRKQNEYSNETYISSNPLTVKIKASLLLNLGRQVRTFKKKPRYPVLSHLSLLDAKQQLTTNTDKGR